MVRPAGSDLSQRPSGCHWRPHPVAGWSGRPGRAARSRYGSGRSWINVRARGPRSAPLAMSHPGREIGPTEPSGGRRPLQAVVLVAQLLVLSLELLLLAAQRLDEVQQPLDHHPRLRVCDRVKREYIEHRAASTVQAELPASIADGGTARQPPPILRGYAAEFCNARYRMMSDNKNCGPHVITDDLTQA